MKKIICLSMALVIIFTSFQIQYLDNNSGAHVYAAESASNKLLSAKPIASAASSAESPTVYGASDERASNVLKKSVLVASADSTTDSAVEIDEAWLTYDLVLNGNGSYKNNVYLVTGDLYLPTIGESGSTISWTSSSEAVEASTGKVTRPSYTNGVTNTTLTASISNNGVIQQKVFNVTICNLSPTDEESVLDDEQWLTYELILDGMGFYVDKYDTYYISDNLYLPTEGCSNISWTSTAEEVVAVDGTIIRPTNNTVVTLTATITCGEKTADKQFVVTVVGLNPTNEERVLLDEAWLTYHIVLNTKVDYVDAKGYSCISGEYDFNMPEEGKNGSTISWESIGQSRVTLTATISSGGVVVEKKLFIFLRYVDPSPEEVAVAADYNWLIDRILTKGDGYTYFESLIKNLYFPTLGENGSTISWASTDETVLSINGTTTRPTYTQGNKNVTVTATISNGNSMTLKKVFNITVLALEPYGEESVTLDKAWLTSELVLNGNSADDVKTDLYLPGSGYYGSSIYWTSGDEAVVTPNGEVGTVIRPTEAQGDKSVRLTASINSGEDKYEKTFDIVVTMIEKAPLALKLDDFSNVEDSIKINGDVDIVETLNSSSQTIQALNFISNKAGGSVFTKNKIHLKDDMSFSTAFSFKINSERIFGFGGFTFTLQADDNSKYSTGYQSLGVGGIEPSISIGFDSSYTGEQGGYYNAWNGVRVFANGDYKNLIGDSYSKTIRAKTDGSPYNVWIEYDGSSETLEIRVTEDSDRPEKATAIINNVDMGAIFTAEAGLSIHDVYAGFTGSSGNASNGVYREVDEIWNWYFKNDSTPIDYDAYTFIDASNITLSANPPGGQSSSTITASVYDGSGSPVADVPVDFSTSVGTLNSSSEITDSSGNASVVLSTTVAGIAVVKAVAAGGAFTSTEVQLVLTDADMVVFDNEWLTDNIILNGNTSLDNIMKDLKLPVLGLNGSTISWVTSDENVVAKNGKVTAPSPIQGNQKVKLTATILKGSAPKVVKEFNITVKVLDADKAVADNDWLTNEIIRKDNSALNDVTTDLNMPTVGPYGSTISWASSNEGVIVLNGKVVRTTYTQGDLKVTLSATLVYGSVTKCKDFDVTVKALSPTDTEAVAFDSDWLTDAIILNGNSNLTNITQNLELPILGLRDTNISWATSKETVVAKDGTVTLPTFTQGEQVVTLTATISRGGESNKKIFELTVKAFAQTVEEAVISDATSLDVSNTLNGNLSQYSICSDLSLPVSGFYGSSISWESSASAAIEIQSGIGVVTRAEYGDGHKSVLLTATISKGLATPVTKVFKYTVLSKPDIILPQITECLPVSESTVVYDTRQISITYSEAIKQGTLDSSTYGIELIGTGAPDFYVRISGKQLIITLDSDMNSGTEYELVIPATAVTDMSGNPLETDFKLLFSVEEKLVNNIEIISTTPEDRQTDVSAHTQIAINFSDSNLFEGELFNSIFLSDRAGNKISVTRSLSGNTVTLSLGTGAQLTPGTVYQITIPARAVEDRFENYNNYETIQFLVKNNEVLPKVVSSYPFDNQNTVDVNQAIEICFSEEIGGFGQSPIYLYDNKGKAISISLDIMSATPKWLVIRPYEALQPDTEYKLLLPHNSIRDTSYNNMAFDYTTSFTTGSDLLSIDKIYPTTTNEYKGASINTSVEIEFSSTVTRVSEYSNIVISDSLGNTIDYYLKEKDNKVVLTPTSEFSTSETYTVNIPVGEYKNESSALNDALEFKFTTAAELDTRSLVVSPSSKWLINKSMTFSMEAVESHFTAFGYKITSFEWSFGDGQTGKDKIPEHTYSTAGKYQVVLSFQDNYGISYKCEQAITIGNYTSSGLSLTVSPGYNKEVVLTDKKSPSILYMMKLKYNEIYLPEEQVKLMLYKNGVFQKQLGSATTGRGTNKWIDEEGNKFTDNGVALYQMGFNTGTFEPGTYEILFVYGSVEGGKVVRVPVTVSDARSKQPMRIKLYNEDKGQYLDYPHGLYFELDGEEKFAECKWYNDEDGYCYIINDVEQTYHTLKLSSSKNSLVYYSDEVGTHHKGVASLISLGIEGKQPGVNNVKSELTNSDDYRDTVFIKDVPMSTLTFEIDGNWDNLTPGYYEIASSSGKFTKKTSTPSFQFRSAYLNTGERLLVRMVSKTGITSPWVDAQVKVVPQPEFGSEINITYVDGEYQINTPMDLAELIGGSADILDGIPLLGNSESFGLADDDYELDGTYDSKYGYIKLNFSKSSSFGTETKKAKMVSTGYKVEADWSGQLRLVYENDEWVLRYGQFRLQGNGYYYWKKGYTIPKIKVGAEAKLQMGSKVGATLTVDKTDSAEREYSGIVYFEPYVYASIRAGWDAANIEGYVEGSVASEFHIPTGYIRINPSLTAGIKAKFLLYTKNIYEKSIYDEYWENDKDKVNVSSFAAAAALQSLMVTLDADDTELKPMSRNYLNRDIQSGETSGKLLMASASSDETNPQDATREYNIYPDAEVRLVRNGDELWLIWIDDNPERSSMNRTQMAYSVLQKDGSWSERSWIGQDGTADFSSAAASTGNGVLMAWQNISQTMEDDAEIGEFIENAEISVTKSLYVDENSDIQTVTLTDDDKYDHSPKLAADGNNALLVWTKSEGLGFNLGEDTEDYQSEANSDSLVFSTWNGTTWTSPGAIQCSLPMVMNSSLTMHGNEGLLLYTLDIDNDMSTQVDQELFARKYDGNSWGGAVSITNNEVSDSNPKAVYSNEGWFITWYQDGSIMFKEGLDGEAKTEDFLLAVQNDYEIALKDGTKSQIALVYRQMGEDNTRTLSAAFYDADKGVWSDEIVLTEGNGYISSFSPTFTENGKLNIAYTEAEIITEVIDGAEYQNASDKVDLHMMTYTPVHDLALKEEDGLQFSPKIPLPGTMATVSATILNQGDFAENATLYLYDGSPEKGVLLGEATTIEPIPARSYAGVEIEWIVASDVRDKYDLYAVVKPDEYVTETDESNNTIEQMICTADIEVADLECENLANDDYLVTATVANRGSRSLEGIKVELTHDLSGQVLDTKEFEQLNPGQEGSLSFLISSDGLTKNKDGKISMTLSAELTDGVKEYSTDNNSVELVLEPKPIVVNRVNPAEGETKVNIQKTITVGFNMNVEKGTGFDQIKLESDNLNSIAISKTLVDKTLTVTLQSALAYNTNYTLTIPVDALGDTYGHTMEKPYSLSFVTTTSNPEVVFAYPGDGMENITSDSAIKVKFNQKILAGPTFKNIVMYGADSKEISAEVTLEGEWLYIDAAALSKNTLYSLTIPGGAVINDTAEAQQEDYSLSFTTGDIKDENDQQNNQPKSSDASEVTTEQNGYAITRQTLEDGTSIVDVLIDSPFIINTKSKDTVKVIVQLTDEVKDDDVIRVSLTANAGKQLISEQIDLYIITGKGNISLPIKLIESIFKDGGNSITITIAKNKSGTNAGRVSDGVFDFTIILGEKTVTEFEQGIIVTIPLEMSKVKNAKRVIACTYDDATDSWQPVGGVADSTKGTITFRTRHFSSFAAFETIKNFEDVTSSWAKEKIEILASRHLIYGTTDKTYNPQGSITRAEFTALIVNSLYTEASKIKGTFGDVAKDSWYADAVQTAYDLGLVSGTGKDRFEPSTKISREQLAVIVYKLYQYKNVNQTTESIDNTFIDRQDISSYAKTAIDFVATAGIMMGSGGRFEPKRSTTRQEAAVVLYGLLEYMGEL